MSEKQAKRKPDPPKQVRVTAKISIPQAKIDPVIANLNALRIAEKPEEIKEQILRQLNQFVDEAFQVGVRVGRQAVLKEIKENKGMVEAPSGLVVPSHLASGNK